MPLSIRYGRSLDEVIGPAVEFLSRPGDLFARPRIVVPTAGAKAWLASELARRLGASWHSDGIVANVDFSYPGTIARLLCVDQRNDDDPWEVERLTFTILEVLTDHAAYETVVKRAGGTLLAARRIADRFDHYHFRRPGMILEWEKGKATLCPCADANGSTELRPLGKNDRWQFNLWREVRDAIGEPSPPAREQRAPGPAPDAVLIAGLQGLSLQQIELVERLATMPTQSDPMATCDVQVVLIHPSPPLGQAWEAHVPQASSSVAPARVEPQQQSKHDVDPLADAWLRGTRESQWLLTICGHHPTLINAQEPPPPHEKSPLLTRLQHSVATGRVTSTTTHADDSVRIHRCHDLGRQAEVLHDAILHAFREIPGLAPHDVVIVSPQIAELAPHLEAVFNRTVKGFSTSGGPTPLELPLVVADRGIREVSPGAELLAAIIEVVGSRCSVDAILAVASHENVRDHFGLDDDAIATWQRCITRTKIRWGIDATRRPRHGLDQPDLRAHTWRLGLERSLLGAVVADGPPEPLLGDVVPLPHGDTAEIKALAPLVSIFRVIDELDQTTTDSRPVAMWCDLLETAIGHLAGDENDDLAIPLREIDALRQAAASAKGISPADTPVAFHDIKTILAAKLAAPVGHQPLRTGAITATSLIPLRGVPFRVVCLAGFDDGAVSPRETDSEDLVARQDLLGDADARLDIRRALLDCVLAAQDRLVITCTGMDVKNNATRPLVTALAEFADFVDRHGVEPFARNGAIHSGIEVFHPRHPCSRRNFLAGDAGVIPSDTAWSHDAAALAAAQGLGANRVPPPVHASTIDPPTHVEIGWLAEFMNDPLWPYVVKTLGIKIWRDDNLSTPATLPLALEHRDRRTLRADFIEQSVRTAPEHRSMLASTWSAAVTANGDVPILGFGDDAIQEITEFTAGLLELATSEHVPLDEGVAETVTLDCGTVKLSGTIERSYPARGATVLLRPDAASAGSPAFHRAKMRAALEVLVLRAAGHAAERGIILSQREEWRPGALDARGRPIPPAQARVVTLTDGMSAARARALLATLCGLYQDAATRPRGLFGETAEKLLDDIDAARDAFAASVASDWYGASLEAIVFGSSPDFDAIFAADPTANGFWRAFVPTQAVSWNAKTKTYVWALP